MGVVHLTFWILEWWDSNFDKTAKKLMQFVLRNVFGGHFENEVVHDFAEFPSACRDFAPDGHPFNGVFSLYLLPTHRS